MKTVIVIPARYHSSRFPGKPLVKILDKPLLEWVISPCIESVGKSNVFVATDDSRIESFCNSIGINAVITSKDCLTGSDRVAEASKYIKSDIYINVQGDEPLITSSDILRIIEVKKRNFNKVVNGYCLIKNSDDYENINVPKVVVNEKNKLIYISRAAIPSSKSGKSSCFRQVCIYAFNKDELLNFNNFSRKSNLENIEDIEILRFFELKHEILMVNLEASTLAVDVPDDINKIEFFLKTTYEP